MSLFSKNINKPESFELECTAHLSEDEQATFFIKPLTKDMLAEAKSKAGRYPYRGDVLMREMVEELKTIKDEYIDSVIPGPDSIEDKTKELTPRQIDELKTKCELRELKIKSEFNDGELKDFEEIDKWKSRYALFCVVSAIDSIQIVKNEDPVKYSEEELIVLMSSIRGTVTLSEDIEVELKPLVFNEIIEHALAMMNLTGTEKKEYAASHGLAGMRREQATLVPNVKSVKKQEN